jgi:hypothetical protein
VASADDRHARIRLAIRPPAAPEKKITKQSQLFFAAWSSADYADFADGMLNNCGL